VERCHAGLSCSETKVDQLDLEIVLFGEPEVLRFEVSVRYLLRVKARHCQHHLPRDLSGFGFLKWTATQPNRLKKVSSI
jgi:hypothetical protein